MLLLMDKRKVTIIIVLLIFIALELYPLNVTNEYVPEGYVTQYDDFAQALKRMDTEFSIDYDSGRNISGALDEIWELHPEIFWIRGQYGIHPTENGRKLNLHYTGPKFMTKIRQIILNTKVNLLVRKINKLPTEEEKVLFIHDYLIDNNYYQAWSSHRGTTYGSIVQGSALCAGYTN